MQIVIEIPERELKTCSGEWTPLRNISLILNDSKELCIEEVFMRTGEGFHSLNYTNLPEGHGRLISADKLFSEVGDINPRNAEHYAALGEFMNLITYAPTVIEADKGVEE